MDSRTAEEIKRDEQELNVKKFEEDLKKRMDDPEFRNTPKILLIGKT